jgi:putative tricarboxylic transport membrane protein
MGIFGLYTLGWPYVLDAYVLFMVCLGTVIGIVVGTLPGLTTTMSVAVMTPLTFTMSPQAAFALLMGTYCGAQYGCAISAVLVNIPGTPAGLMTILDGYPMAQRGEAGRALGLSIWGSFIGGIVGIAVLGFFAPPIAEFALRFGSQEYFGVMVFGLSVIVYVSYGSMIKGLFSGLLGILLGCIGFDPVTAYPRYYFGSVDLMGGLELIPMMIGCFGVAELLSIAEKKMSLPKAIYKITIRSLFPTLVEFIKLIPTLIRSSLIGLFIGILPAAGGTIASIVAYGVEKRCSKNPERFGHGAPEGVTAAETANNSSTGGAMIPFLTLGIPGDAVTAVLIGALLIHGLQPGPMLFQNNPEVVSSMFILLALSNFLFVIFGIVWANGFARLINVSYGIMVPTIMTLCVVGSYAIRNSFFDIGVLGFFGILGFLMKKVEMSPAPMVLGFILGPMIENNLRRGLISSFGDFSTFFTRPLSALFLSLTILVLVSPYIVQLFTGRKMERIVETD